MCEVRTSNWPVILKWVWLGRRTSKVRKVRVWIDIHLVVLIHLTSHPTFHLSPFMGMLLLFKLDGSGRSHVLYLFHGFFFLNFAFIAFLFLSRVCGLYFCAMEICSQEKEDSGGPADNESDDGVCKCEIKSSLGFTSFLGGELPKEDKEMSLALAYLEMGV